MKTNKVKAIYKKEIMDLLRDKKTLIMMVVVPLILYPLIMIVALLVSSAVASNMQEKEYNVAIYEVEEASNLEELGYNRQELIDVIVDKEDKFEYNLQVIDASDKKDTYMEELVLGNLDTVLNVSVEDGKLLMEVAYLSSETNSNTASDMVADKLEIYRKKIASNILVANGMDADSIINPISLSWKDGSSKEESLGSILGMIIPFLLIVSILMGAIYPAIDTTAGEKERGTLETLLTLPVKNTELIMGKFLAVSAIACVSAMLNLISMGLMGLYMYNVMLVSDSAAASVDLTGFIPAIIIVVLCIIAFALFISAVCMCVTTFAKSFKEANNYVTPLMLVIMLAGYIGFIPNIEFNGVMASIPVVNICLLIGDILVFKYDFAMIFIVLLTNITYAALAIILLSRIYSTENILFSEGGMSLNLFEKRSDIKKGGVPSFSDAVLIVAVSILLLLYVGSIVQLKFLLFGLFLTQLMIIGVPVVAAWYSKRDWKETFSLNVPKISHVVAAVLMEIGVFIVILLLSELLTTIWPQDASNVNESFDLILAGAGFIPTFLVIAVAPAICEEGLFRGYLFSASRKKFNITTAIIIVSALFGLYHMSLVKFFTTGLLGVAFAYVVYKSGSIFTSMLMHCINNGIAVVITFYPEAIGKILPFLTKDSIDTKSRVLLIIVAGVCVAAGLALLNLKRKESVIEEK